MSHRFFRCRLCGLPHEAGTSVCPVTKQPIAASPFVPPEAPAAAPGIPRPSRVPSFDALRAPPRAAPAAPSPAVHPGPPRAPSSPAVVPPPKRSSHPTLPATRAGQGEPHLPTRSSNALPPDPLAGAVIDGRWRVQGVLAQGGMGIVYEGVHIDLGRRVAIKALTRRHADDPVAIQRLRKEARLASALGHPNIIEVYDMGTLPDGAPYLVMERLDGETLAQRMRRERTLPVPDVVEIVQQVLSALAATHERGVLHRDLKPENVFLSRRPGLAPLVKVLDFGISKMMEAKSEDTGNTLTRTGFVMGTPAYMAPEQARGERRLDGRVDLYAVGVLSYEMLLGRLPFTSKNPAMLIVEMQKTQPVNPRRLRPEVPSWLEAAVLKLLSFHRNDRFTSAAEALSAFTAFGVPPAPSPPAARALAPAPAIDDADPTIVTGPPAIASESADTSQKVRVFSWTKK